METIFVLSWNVSFDVSWVILICCFCFDRFFCLWKNLCFCFRDFFWQIWQNVVDVFFAFEVGDRDRDVEVGDEVEAIVVSKVVKIFAWLKHPS